jgi:coenzyme F420-reducing hydrogenase delta subunit/Fe-S-cluster-containing hydrogenase component 2
MCTGRLDLAFLLRSFVKGADGVFIAGCHLNECNYVTHGNFYALSMVHLCKQLLAQAGVSPERLRMELISGGEGNRFAEIVNEFSSQIKELGPIGTGEREDGEKFKFGLENMLRLVPYIKMVKKEKLGTRLHSEEDYSELYTKQEIDELLEDVPSYYIDPEKCQACMTCAKRCPVDAIEGGKNLIHVIDQDTCIKCGTCWEVCPPRFGAVTKIRGSEVPLPLPKEQRIIVRRGKEKQAV